MRWYCLFPLVLFACLTGCEPAKLKEPDPVTLPTEEKKDYPFFRDLADSNGRVIRAEVLGRDETSVTFVRWNDKKRFTVPIASLSPKDQNHLLALPLFDPRAPDDPRYTSPQRDSKRGTGEKEVKPELTGYAALLQGRIEETEKEIEIVRTELQDQSIGSIQRRTLHSRLRDLSDELAEMNQRMRQYQ